MPSLTSFVQNSRQTSEANSLIMSLDFARTEAIKEDANVQICASANGQTCSGDVAAGGWWTGWIVQTLPPTPNAPTVLQAMPALGANNTLSATFTVAGVLGNISQVTFQANGFVQAAAGSNNWTSTYFTLCDVRGSTWARDVEITATGAVQASPTAGETLAGAAVNCP
jgi:type IV fimbrial biogenesis protein FimT